MTRDVGTVTAVLAVLFVLLVVAKVRTRRALDQWHAQRARNRGEV